jgi:two-component system, OmpR family, sensor histidine kinase CreC
MKHFGLGFWFYTFYLVVIFTIAWVLVNKSLDSVEVSVKQAAEEVMVDAANLLAVIISKDVTEKEINIEQIKPLIENYLDRQIKAKIYDLDKTKPNLQVYVTNKQGIVLYDSTGRFIGNDFSQWHDVYLTLKGEYGARASAYGFEDNADDALFVAAPIISKKHNAQIIGVVTVYKSIKNLENFVQQQNQSITHYAYIIFIIFLVFGAIFTWLLSRSIQKLVVYANTLAKGKKIKQPKINQQELQVLSSAIKHMRDELDGKEYVENYIHLMAHELKTPITGIQNAAELLLDPMPDDKRIHFTSQVLDSTKRMTLLIEHLLRLAELEKKDTLENIETIDLVSLLKSSIRDQKTPLLKKQMSVDLDVKNTIKITGDKLLVEQAISNILDNAIDFSDEKSTLRISLIKDNNQAKITIIDQGSGIPDYALPKLFDRFFSLARPDSNKKSTGLGLRFVKEIIELHHGKISINNYNDSNGTGVKVDLFFSLKLTTTSPLL